MQLKGELTKRGLPKSGLKGVLVARLQTSATAATTTASDTLDAVAKAVCLVSNVIAPCNGDHDTTELESLGLAASESGPMEEPEPGDAELPWLKPRH